MTATDTDEAGLLRAVCDQPGNDTPRLVYADWLDDQPATETCGAGCTTGQVYAMRTCRDGIMRNAWGDCPTCSGRGWVPSGAAARAEFIRVQVELARTPMCCPICNPETGHRDGCVNGDRGDVLRRREQELWEGSGPSRNHGSSLLPHPWFDLPGSAPNVMLHGPSGCWIHTTVGGARVEWGVRRGFVDELRVPDLATLFGGGCGWCDGREYVFGDGTSRPACEACGGVNSRIDGDGRLIEQKNGTGTTPGIVRQVFTQHPVTRIVVADREPEDLGYGWGWRFEGVDNGPEQLPDELWTKEGTGWVAATRQDALEAFSGACVLRSRLLAGLPPIDRMIRAGGIFQPHRTNS